MHVVGKTPMEELPSNFMVHKEEDLRNQYFTPFICLEPSLYRFLKQWVSNCVPWMILGHQGFCKETGVHSRASWKVMHDYCQARCLGCTSTHMAHGVRGRGPRTEEVI